MLPVKVRFAEVMRQPQREWLLKTLQPVRSTDSATFGVDVVNGLQDALVSMHSNEHTIRHA